MRDLKIAGVCILVAFVLFGMLMVSESIGAEELPAAAYERHDFNHAPSVFHSQKQQIIDMVLEEQKRLAELEAERDREREIEAARVEAMAEALENASTSVWRQMVQDCKQTVCKGGYCSTTTEKQLFAMCVGGG